MRGDIDITLLNPRPRFVQRLRLHQLVARTCDATADYGPLLGAGIRLVVDTATRIDSGTRTVQLASSMHCGCAMHLTTSTRTRLSPLSARG